NTSRSGWIKCSRIHRSRNAARRKMLRSNPGARRSLAFWEKLFSITSKELKSLARSSVCTFGQILNFTLIRTKPRYALDWKEQCGLTRLSSDSREQREPSFAELILGGAYLVTSTKVGTSQSSKRKLIQVCGASRTWMSTSRAR